MADKEVRLIDKDKLIKKINAEIDAWAKSRMCMTADELLETIEEFEEEAEPVKHGRWEHGECSVCGASPLDHVSGDMYVEVDYYPNYCPSCGSQNVDLWIDDESVPNEDMRPDNESI